MHGAAGGDRRRDRGRRRACRRLPRRARRGRLGRAGADARRRGGDALVPVRSAPRCPTRTRPSSTRQYRRERDRRARAAARPAGAAVPRRRRRARDRACGCGGRLPRRRADDVDARRRGRDRAARRRRARRRRRHGPRRGRRARLAEAGASLVVSFWNPPGFVAAAAAAGIPAIPGGFTPHELAAAHAEGAAAVKLFPASLAGPELPRRAPAAAPGPAPARHRRDRAGRCAALARRGRARRRARQQPRHGRDRRRRRGRAPLPRRARRRVVSTATRAVLFDFNGTLSHDEPIWFEVYRELYAARGRPITREEYFEQLAGPVGRGGSRDSGSARAIPSSSTRGSRRFLAAAGDGSTVPLASREAVAAAAALVPVGIVTTARRAVLDRILAAAGLTRRTSRSRSRPRT